MRSLQQLNPCLVRRRHGWPRRTHRSCRLRRRTLTHDPGHPDGRPCLPQSLWRATHASMISGPSVEFTLRSHPRISTKGERFLFGSRCDTPSRRTLLIHSSLADVTVVPAKTLAKVANGFTLKDNHNIDLPVCRLEDAKFEVAGSLGQRHRKLGTRTCSWSCRLLPHESTVLLMFNGRCLAWPLVSISHVLVQLSSIHFGHLDFYADVQLGCRHNSVLSLFTNRFDGRARPSLSLVPKEISEPFSSREQRLTDVSNLDWSCAHIPPTHQE